MRKRIDTFLNTITMYRLVLYGLIGLAFVSFIYSGVGMLPYKPLQLFTSLSVFLLLCVVINTIFVKRFKIYSNIESSYITAFILFFIIPPATNNVEVVWLAVASIVATGSKYIMAIKHKHIFNPVAIAAVFLMVTGGSGASWWVGSAVLAPFTIILGLLIVHKIRRFPMFFSFIVAAFISVAIVGLINGENVPELIGESISSWPLIFFGMVMLTEPLTTPPTHTTRLVYGALVGLLFGARFHVGPFYSTPELALVCGNIFSYVVSPKYRLRLLLKEKKLLSKDIYEFILNSPTQLKYRAGQYLEWTVVPKRADARGNRRYFTIASSPTESHIRLTMKIPKEASSFKRSMMAFKPGDALCASQLAGDFVLPKVPIRKLAFIAGGIGITPFRSMLKSIIDLQEKRDIILLYAAPHPEDFIYQDIIGEAHKYGANAHYIITKKENAPQGWKGRIGRIDASMLQETIPDFKERLFYLSGPNSMVDAYKNLLKVNAVKESNIITDYFPGL